MTVEFCDVFSVELCRANPDKIYVFGDNLLKRGKGGQAVIRDEPNTFGIPTKRAPSMAEGSFFSDKPDEARAITEVLGELLKLMQDGKTLVFPAAGLGTGLAQLEQRSPLIWKYLNYSLTHLFFTEVE